MGRLIGTYHNVLVAFYYYYYCCVMLRFINWGGMGLVNDHLYLAALDRLVHVFQEVPRKVFASVYLPAKTRTSDRIQSRRVGKIPPG